MRLSPRNELKTIRPGSDIDIEGEGEILKIAAEPGRTARARSKSTRRTQIITSRAVHENPDDVRDPPLRSRAAQGGADVRRRAERRMDAEDPRHPEGEGRQGDVLHRRPERRDEPAASCSASSPRDTRSAITRLTHPNLGETSDEVSRIEINATQRLVRGADGPLDAAVPRRSLWRCGADDAERDQSRQAGAERSATSRWASGSIPTTGRAAGRRHRAAGRYGAHGRYQSRDARTGGADARRGAVTGADGLGPAARHRCDCAPRASTSCRCRRARRLDVRSGHAAAAAGGSPALVNWYVFITASWVQATMHFLSHARHRRGLARLVLLCGLALWSRYRPAPVRRSPRATAFLSRCSFRPSMRPRSSGSRSQRILDSTGVEIEVIVIDDGSSDGTSDVVRDRFGADPRVIPSSRSRTAARREPSNGARACARRNHRRARCRYAVRARYHRQADALVRRSENREPWHGNARGRQPHQHADALAGARIHHLAEPGAPRAGGPRLHLGHSGRGRAWRNIGSASSSAASRPTRWPRIEDPPSPSRPLGYRAVFDADALAWTEAPDTVKGLGQTTVQVVVWNAAMLVEARASRSGPVTARSGLIALPQA